MTEDGRGAEPILAIDAGQTGIRARLESAGGWRDFEFPGIRTDRALLPQLADVVREVHQQVAEPITVVGAGVSGLTADEADPDGLLGACRAAGVRHVTLAHDSVTSYLAAMGDARGVVIAVGTGVVTLGVGATTVARVDGWGYLIGDAGSGYWIGRAALEAVLRAHDGRGAATTLTEVVSREFPDLESAYIRLQSDPGRVKRIAAFSRAVTEAAATDAVAATICDAAAAELVLSAATALERVGEAEASAPVVSGLGGVLTAREIRDRFVRGIRDRWPAADLRFGAVNGLDGAARAAVLEPGTPLSDLVARSRG